MAHKFFEEGRFKSGLTYKEYSEAINKKVETTNPAELDETSDKLFEFTKLNQHRSNRIDKIYKVSEELVEILNAFEKEQMWMVITEDWCGDSAQNLPYIAKMAGASDKIDLRIISRDENLDIMDLYLTNGIARSIPKLVAFDKEGNELFQWGPRPKELVELVNQWKTEMEPEKWKEKIQLWYGRDRGKTIDKEFIDFLK